MPLLPLVAPVKFVYLLLKSKKNVYFIMLKSQRAGTKPDPLATDYAGTPQEEQ